MVVSLLRRQPRRAALLFAAATVAVALLATAGSTVPALAVSGNPYNVALAVDSNPAANIFETTIVADEATVDIGNGVMAHAQAFNGTVPGPEFRLHVGDTVIVHFENHLDSEVTGIHWHGVELANASDGTPLVQNQVPPGGKFLYKFIVPRPGIFWYHPHHHASTNQVFKGLIGSIIVQDADEEALQASGVLPPESQTKTLALSDTTVCKAPGTNDAATFDSSLPHVSGAVPLPAQPGPFPTTLCDTPFDSDGNTGGPALAAGDIPNVQNAGTSGRVNEGQTVLTNGVNVGGRAGTPSAPGALAAGAKLLDVQAGQGLRLRLGNETVVRFFRLILTDNTGTQIPIVRVGGQGGLLDEAVVEGGVVSGFDFKYTSGEILLDPGDRQDVVIAIPPTATGVLTMWTQDFDRTGQGFANTPTVPVAHFNVTGTAASTYTIAAGTDLLTSIGQAVEVIGPPTASLLDPTTDPPFSPPKPGLASQDIRLTQVGGTSLGINDVLGEHDFPGDYKDTPHPGSARYAKLGDTLQLTVTNTTTAHHPFHLHGFSIQPISLTDTIAPINLPSYTWPYHEFRDNVDVPKGYTLTFRIRLDDRPLMDGVTPGGGIGRWVFHCHIFFHAVFGMISEFDVVAADGNERPYTNADVVDVTVNEGQTANATGTYKDPDGDAVTLTASLGTVVNNNDGTWSWSFPTTDGPDENQIVAITATDPQGFKDQAIFNLNVNNLPPDVSISSPTNGQIFQLNSPVPVTAPFTDPGTGDTHTCSIDWGDGVIAPGTVAEVNGSGSCTGSHSYATGGPKTIKVTVDDDDGGSDNASVNIIINNPPNCAAVTISPNSLAPPNHKFVTATLTIAPDPDGDPVTQSITAVTQDEPTNGLGDGDTGPPDAKLLANPNKVDLRSERSGNGDGRVYRVTFQAQDNKGGSCVGTVKVGVAKGNSAPIDSAPPSFNSL
jgi:FtsP/CotA-like multicopper oxidase with cupredoxin domain